MAEVCWHTGDRHLSILLSSLPRFSRLNRFWSSSLSLTAGGLLVPRLGSPFLNVDDENTVIVLSLI